MRLRLSILLFLCVALVLAAGCGAGKFITPSRGSLTVRAQWPTADGSLRQQALPAAGTALRVSVRGEGLEVPMVQRQARSAGALADRDSLAKLADEMSFTFESVPQGPKTVRATVLDVNGNEIATGEVSTNVEPGKLTQAAIEVHAIGLTLGDTPSVKPGLPSASPSAPAGTIIPSPSAPAPSATPRSDKPAGQLLQPIDFGGPRPFAVALDQGGTLWVTLAGGLLARRTPDGATNITTVGDQSHAIAFDSQGRGWIPSGALKTPVVYVVNPKGNTESKAISYLRAGPLDVAIDAGDYLWLPLAGGDIEPKRVLQIWAPDGTVTETFVGFSPTGVAIDPQGRAWVTNYDDDTISIVSRAGGGTTATVGFHAQRTAQIPDTITIPAAGNGPSGIAISPQGVAWWVTDDDFIHFLDTNNPKGTPTNIELDEFSTGLGRVAIDANTGDVWVSATDAGLLVQLNAQGQVLSVTEVGVEPQGLAIAGDGSVFVATEDGVAHVRGVGPPKASDPTLLGPPVSASGS